MTEQTLRDVLRRAFPAEDEPALHQLSSDGANYTSALYAVTLRHRTLFAKVANVSEEMRVVMNAGHMYSTELYVYERLAPVYAELQRDVPREQRYVFPEYCGGSDECGRETVLLEDLRARGFGAPDRLVSASWEQASSAVTALASFHALSFVLSRARPGLHAEALGRLAAPPRRDTADESGRDAVERMARSALDAVTDPLHRDKLRALLARDTFINEFTKFREPLSVPVICHGDYRSSNLLIKKTEGGEVQTMVVDYQTTHAGSPASDLLYYYLLGTDQAFRRRHHARLLAHYHAQLGRALALHHMQLDTVYPWDTFQREIKQLLGGALRVCVVLLPLVTVHSSQAPRPTRGDVSQFAVPPTPLFQERFNSLVQDCVEWGAL